ncbi:MAG: phosphate ABC transporter permease subunit PstC [Bacillota bacterium]|nr:phosphate ABC transporter permease subunit PstC [Bacillota bacterium]
MPSKAKRLSDIKEGGFKGLFLFCAFCSLLFLLAIFVYLLVSATPFIAKVGVFEFLFGTSYAPLASAPSYGILSMILTSIYVTLLSMVIGCGLGLLTAICLFRFLPHPLIRPIKALIDLLSAIPSVIFGLFGLIIIVPFMREYISPSGIGYGILSASIVLGVMILPTMVSVSLDSLNAVDKTYYEGALALGSSSTEAVFKVVLPASKSGIIAAMVLSSGRALGETMAVIMVIGGSASFPTSLFQSVRTLTANIAMGALESTGDAFDVLLATGLVLFFFSLLINVGFALIKGRSRHA